MCGDARPLPHNPRIGTVATRLETPACLAADAVLDYDGRMVKRVRSRFWVVSTHVLATAMAVPLLAAILALMAIVIFRIQGLPALLLSVVSQTTGYIGGAYASLFLLRKSTILANPSRCTKPAVSLFVVLELFTLVTRLLTDKRPSTVSAAWIIAFYALIALAVARITQKKFDAWEAAIGVVHNESPAIAGFVREV